MRKIQKLLIRLLCGKTIVVANLDGLPWELFTGLNSICQHILRKEVLFINTYAKPYTELAGKVKK